MIIIASHGENGSTGLNLKALCMIVSEIRNNTKYDYIAHGIATLLLYYGSRWHGDLCFVIIQ